MSDTKPQTLPVAAYVDGLSSILHGTIASDAQGQGVDFDAAIAAMLDMVRVCKEAGGKIIFVGNGGSASIASHMAIDYNNMVGVAALALNDGAMLTCLGNDFGYEHVFDKQLGFMGQSGDVLIAISSSGNSQNILNAVSVARDKGMTVVSMSGFSADNALRQRGDLNFYVDSSRYGYVEIAHLTLCHAVADMSGEWKPEA